MDDWYKYYKKIMENLEPPEFFSTSFFLLINFFYILGELFH